MTNQAKWEVVGGGTGDSMKRRQQNRKAVDIDEMRRQRAYIVDDDENESDGVQEKLPLRQLNGKAPGPAKATKPSPPSPAKKASAPTLQAVLGAVTPANVNSQVSASRPDVTLSQLLLFLDKKLEGVPDVNVTNGGFQPDYPSGLLKKAVRSKIIGLINEVPTPQLTHFIREATEECVGMCSTKQPAHAHKTLLQMVAAAKPGLVAEDSQRMLEIAQSHKASASMCQLIFWLAGNCGVDLSAGITSWIGVMLPFIKMPGLQSWIIAYITRLLDFHNVPQPGKHMAQSLQLACSAETQAIVAPLIYFRLHDLCSTASKLAPAIRKELATPFARIQQVCIPPAAVQFFPSFMARTQHFTPLPAILCLTDENVWASWPSHLVAFSETSKILLKSLHDNNKDIGQYLPGNVQDVLVSLRRKIEEVPSADLQALLPCVNKLDSSVKQTAKVRSSGNSSSFLSTLVKLMIYTGLLLVFVLACDLGFHGGVKKSAVGHFLRQHPELNSLKYCLVQTEIATRRAIFWTQSTVIPYASQIVDAASTGVLKLWKDTTPQRRVVEAAVSDAATRVSTGWTLHVSPQIASIESWMVQNGLDFTTIANKTTELFRIAIRPRVDMVATIMMNQYKMAMDSLKSLM